MPKTRRSRRQTANTPAPPTPRRRWRQSRGQRREREAAAAAAAAAAASAEAEERPAYLAPSYEEHEDPGEPPMPMPEHLCEQVPDFARCGRQRCCLHVSVADVEVAWACRDCGLPGSAQAPLHRLACAHALCWSCLHRAVGVVDQRLQQRWGTIEAALQEHFWGTEEEKDGKKQTAHHRALDAAGLLCCGQPLPLARYVGCLTPRFAQACWLADGALRWPPDLTSQRCGWPDCRQYLYPAYAFERRGAAIYYCVQCRGNSLCVRPGEMVPAQ